MVWSLLYGLTRNTLGVMLLRVRGNTAKDIEIVVVRHEALFFVPNGGGRPSSPCRRSGGVKLEAA